jgi:hypothetical protein
MNRLHHTLAWLYARLLTCYPPDFYAQFGEEMQTIFQLRLSEAGGSSLRVGITELVTLLFGVIRERQRTPSPISTRWMLLLLSIPVLAGGLALFVRPIGLFFQPGKMWLVFAGLTVLLAVVGWLSGRHWLVLAFPLMGFMLSIGLREFFYGSVNAPGYGYPIEVQYGIPYLIVCGMLMAFALFRRGMRPTALSWLALLIATPVILLTLTMLVSYLSGSVVPATTLEVLYQDYLRWVWILPGTLAIILLIGLPFALLCGSQAVLIMVGFLFSELIGLTATLPTEIAQRIGAGIFLAIFFVVIPTRVLQSGPKQQRLTGIVSTGVITSYAIFFFLHILGGEIFAIPPLINLKFLWYRAIELVQTLIMLIIACGVYAHFGRYQPVNDAPAPQQKKRQPAEG